MHCEYTLRSALERSDLVANFRVVAGVGCCLNLNGAFVEYGNRSAHLGLDNEHYSMFDVEHGSDVAWAITLAATVIFDGSAEQYSEMKSVVHCSGYLSQHQERGRFVVVGGCPACGDVDVDGGDDDDDVSVAVGCVYG